MGPVHLTLPLALLAIAASPAQVRPLRFEYARDRAERCPDEATIRSAVAARVGFEPFDAEAKPILRVTISPEQTGFRAEIAIVDEADTTRTRRLSGVQPDCADLALALPFALSVAVESFSASAPPAPPELPVKPAPVVELAAAKPPPPPPALVPEPALRPLALLHGAAALGVGPTVTAQLSLGGGVQRGALSLGLEARFVVPSSVAVGAGRIEATALGADLVPCFSVGVANACGLVGAGALWSRAIGLSGARDAVTPLFSLGARVEAFFPLGRWLRLGAFLELRGALSRALLKVGAEEVWAMPVVSGAAGLVLVISRPVTDLD